MHQIAAATILVAAMDTKAAMQRDTVFVIASAALIQIVLEAMSVNHKAKDLYVSVTQ